MDKKLRITLELILSSALTGASLWYATNDKLCTAVALLTIALFWGLLVFLNEHLINQGFWKRFIRSNQRTTPEKNSGRKGIIRTQIEFAKVKKQMSQGGTAALSYGHTATRFVWGAFKLDPWLWSGVLAALSALYLFSQGELHFGLFALLVVAYCFISHFNQWSVIGQYVSSHKVETWIAASVTCLAITVGHGWWYGAFLSSISTVTATITMIPEGWNHVGKWVTIAGGKLWFLLSGQIGPKSALFGWSIILGTTGVSIWFAGWNLGADVETLQAWTFTLFTLSGLLFVTGIGVTTFQVTEKVAPRLGIKNKVEGK